MSKSVQEQIEQLGRNISGAFVDPAYGDGYQTAITDVLHLFTERPTTGGTEPTVACIQCEKHVPIKTVPVMCLPCAAERPAETDLITEIVEQYQRQRKMYVDAGGDPTDKRWLRSERTVYVKAGIVERLVAPAKETT